MATQPTASPQPSDRDRIAPLWHTVVFLLVVIGLAALDVRRIGHAPAVPHGGRLRLYAVSVAFEWAMVGYIWLLGLRPAGKRLRDIVGGAWTRWWEPLRDIGVAFVFWLVVLMVLGTLRFSLGDNPDQLRAMKLLVPQNTREMIGFLALAVTAGFCEEIMFRGYLQRQFLALTGRIEIAVALQAVVFGMAHTYQGWKGAVTIGVYGAMFGTLAVIRKSLRPGMMQHAFQDSLAGIAIRLLSKRGLV
ncbi:MAG TPA: type II CAAX endopeptidase family protein [Candidatus Acidoferrales bacterium]|nr:type II CAAX endopeptidase family protein [Candidatus Acidoferrales bacterium]